MYVYIGFWTYTGVYPHGQKRMYIIHRFLDLYLCFQKHTYTSKPLCTYTWDFGHIRGFTKLAKNLCMHTCVFEHIPGFSEKHRYKPKHLCIHTCAFDHIPFFLENTGISPKSYVCIHRPLDPHMVLDAYPGVWPNTAVCVPGFWTHIGVLAKSPV